MPDQAPTSDDFAGRRSPEPESDEISFARSTREFFKESIPQAIGGVRDAAQNVLNLAVNRPATWLEEKFPLGTLDGNSPYQPLTLPTVRPAETTGGAILRGTSQFLVPYITALRIIGTGQGAFQIFARAEGIAVLTEQAVFDPFEARLSDFVQQIPGLANPVTEYLASSPEDTEAEARLKMVLEGTGLGIMAGSVIGAVKGLRHLKRGETEQALEEIRLAEARIPEIEPAPPPSAFLGGEAALRERAININLKNISTPDDVKNVLQVTADSFEGRIQESRRGAITIDQTIQMAREAGVSVEDLLARQTGEAFNAEKILSARMMMAQSADNLLEKAKLAAASGTDTDLLAYKGALNLHVAIQEQVSGLAAEAGRALRQFQIAAGVDVENLLTVAGGKRNLRDSATLISQFGNAEELAAAAKAANAATPMDKFLEVWINGLLSGPQTHAVNAMSNTLTAMWSIPEHFLAAGIGAVRRTEGRETFSEVASRTWGFVQGARDGFRLAAKAFITEDPSDLFSKLEGRHPRAIEGRLGGIVRVPGRALVAADEFFKSIGYRMELNSRAYRSAMDAGFEPRTREFSQHMQEVINNPPDDIKLAAIDNARYLTFTKPLEGISRHITAAQADLPALRLIMPFVRTPTNIVRFASERTPFGLLMREFKNSRGTQRDLQYAKLAIGSMAGAAVVSLAAEGLITGSGPSDPSARAILRNTGWQPYSFVVDTDEGKRYVSFSRIEPLGILFGIAADFNQIAGELSQDDADHIGAMIAGAISQNLTDKTFFKGLSDLVEATSDPDRFMDVYAQSLGGTIVPTGVAQWTRTVDPVLRDTRGMVDRIMSRIPGFSDDLPARRNLWGEPILLSGGVGPDIISPLYSSFQINDPVTNELVRLEFSPTMPSRLLDGEELEPEDYWGFVEAAGKPAHEQLMRIVTSEGWRRLDHLPSEQQEVIAEVISTHRAAQRVLLRIKLGKTISARDRAVLEDLGITP